MNGICIFWFRRDLRLEDNHGLYKALSSGLKVLPIFIFDKNILNKLESKNDPRVTFIYNQLERLQTELDKYQSGIRVYCGTPQTVFEKLIFHYKDQIKMIVSNKDYTPYSIERDRNIEKLSNDFNIKYLNLKDHVILEETELVKSDNKPYTIFTPYKRKWLDVTKNETFLPFDSKSKLKGNLLSFSQSLPTIENIGFGRSNINFPIFKINEQDLCEYDKNRDFPYLKGTTKWGIHLRFGTVSIRFLMKLASKHSQTLLSELIWREFYQMILFNFPHFVNRAFKSGYNRIQWLNNENYFSKWQEGKTGYPLVDAGMRELNQTGFMHNRLRMVTASLLTKHLLIDWKWGERYFAQKLLDFELASNVGGWQWAAGTGRDAAPYFRIFNPLEQQKKFDPDFIYIKKWVPEYNSPNYQEMIVNHKEARTRAIETYKLSLNSF